MARKGVRKPGGTIRTNQVCGCQPLQHSSMDLPSPSAQGRLPARDEVRPVVSADKALGCQRQGRLESDPRRFHVDQASCQHTEPRKVAVQREIPPPAVDRTRVGSSPVVCDETSVPPPCTTMLLPSFRGARIASVETSSRQGISGMNARGSRVERPDRPQSSGGSPLGAILTRRGSNRASGSTRSR